MVPKLGMEIIGRLGGPALDDIGRCNCDEYMRR